MQRRMAWAGSSAGRMPSVRVSSPHAVDRLVVRGAQDLQPPGVEESGELRPDARVVEPRRDRVRLDDLAVLVLEQVRARAVQDARRAARERRGVTAAPAPPPRPPHRPGACRLADEAGEQADGVGAAADAGDGDVGQPALDAGGPAPRPRRR